MACKALYEKIGGYYCCLLSTCNPLHLRTPQVLYYFCSFSLGSLGTRMSCRHNTMGEVRHLSKVHQGASRTEICFYCVANYFAFCFSLMRCRSCDVITTQILYKKILWGHFSTELPQKGGYLHIGFYHDINLKCELSQSLASINSVSRSVSFPFAPAFPCVTLVFSAFQTCFCPLKGP